MEIDSCSKSLTSGTRLRTNPVRRTETEYIQLLRLGEIENKELKDCLRYVEIQLAKTKETLRTQTVKYESLQEEVQRAHEQIARSANINHASMSQIEEMSKKLATVSDEKKGVNDKFKVKIQEYQNEVDLRELEITRLSTILKEKTDQLNLKEKEESAAQSRLNDVEEELEMKSGESNRLRRQVADLEAALHDLFRSRKGEGTLQIEMEALKQDNERLIAMLKDTCEYADLNEADIIKTSMTLNAKGGFGETQKSNARVRGSTPEIGQKGQSGSNKRQDGNDWIPTEAVRKLSSIKTEFKGQLSETCLSRILYDLNQIWRNIMRTETVALKKRMNAQIQDLRRQIISKGCHEKDELLQQVTRVKRDLFAAELKLQKSAGVSRKQESLGVSMRSGVGGKQNENNSLVDVLESIQLQKSALRTANTELQSRIDKLEREQAEAQFF